ncbi:MAG: hypothetical protein MJE66_20720 [Proteobacteria bacterium]|nr:hypothetical protein [Pseudomonadota bacterium]
MLNVPWYGWLNVLGLLILWAFYWIEHHTESTTSLQRGLHHLVVFGSLAFILAGWNAPLPSSLDYAVAGLAVLVVPLVGRELLGSFVGLFFASEEDGASEEDAEAPAAPAEEVPATPAPAAADRAPVPDYAVDLDEGTLQSRENREAASQAIQTLFAPDSSDGDRLRGLGDLLSLGESEDEEEEAATERMASVLTMVLVLAVLVPPSYLAIRMFARTAFTG